MKRIFALFSALCLLLCLSACGKDNVTPTGSTPSSPKGTEATLPKPTATEGTAPLAPEETLTQPDETTGDHTLPTQPEASADPTSPVLPTTPTQPTEPAQPTEPTQSTEPNQPTQPPAPHIHSYSSSITKAAGCTAKGIKTYRCSCGASYTEDISATGHNWGQWVTTKAPSVTEEGNSQRKCANCQDVENKVIPKLPDPGPANGAVTREQLDQIYELFLTYVNAERIRVGAAPLTTNSYLDSVAQLRSTETLELFSHTRPNGEPWHSLIDSNAYPYITVGENLCMTSHVGDGSYTPADKWVGSRSQVEAAASWIFVLFKNSPGHYANMINADFKECGIGISFEMFTDDIPLFYLAHIFGARS